MRYVWRYWRCWTQLDTEAPKLMFDRSEDSGKVADRIDHSDMEDERGCSRPVKI